MTLSEAYPTTDVEQGIKQQTRELSASAISSYTTNEKVEIREETPSSQDVEFDLPAPPKELIRTETTGSFAESDVNGSRPACFRNTVQECLFVLTTTIAIAQTSIFSGMTFPITAYIAADLHMSAAEVTWISASQSLSAGCFLLFFGRVADLFGRRIVFLASMFSFTITLLIAGFAPNAIFLNSFCGLMGICSAAAVPPAIGILGAVYRHPSKRKNKAFACFSAGNPLGSVVGSFISGVVMKVSNWRTCFWAIAVIYAFFCLVAWWTVPPDEASQERLPWNMETLAKFDFLGTFLAIAGVACFTASLTLGGDAVDGWRTPYVLILLFIGLFLIALLIYWQSICAYPLMPLSVWRDRNFSFLVVTLCFGFLGFSTIAFWISLFWQRLLHYSPLEVALRIFPQAIMGILANVVAALIMHRVSNKLIMAIGAMAYVVAFALLSAMNGSSSYWIFVFPALLFSVFGADFQFTVTNMYVMSTLPPSQQSVAGGLFNTVVRLSTSIGYGVTTAVFSATTKPTSPDDLEGQFLPYRATFWVALGFFQHTPTPPVPTAAQPTFIAATTYPASRLSGFLQWLLALSSEPTNTTASPACPPFAYGINGVSEDAAHMLSVTFTTELTLPFTGENCAPGHKVVNLCGNFDGNPASYPEVTFYPNLEYCSAAAAARPIDMNGVGLMIKHGIYDNGAEIVDVGTTHQLNIINMGMSYTFTTLVFSTVPCSMAACS